MTEKSVLLSQSERACAASHLAVWRAIAAHLSAATTAGTFVTDNNVNINNNSTDASAKRAAVLVIEQHARRNMSPAVAGGQYLLAPLQQPTNSDNINTSYRSGTDKSSDIMMRSNIAASDQSSQYFLIMEDDACVSSEFAGLDLQQHLSHILRRMPADCDILYLGGSVPPNATRKSIQGGRFIKVNYCWQLHAYLVRKKAVDILLFSLPINAPVDNFIAAKLHYGELTAYILGRPLFVQRSFVKTRTTVDTDIVHSAKRYHKVHQNRPKKVQSLPAVQTTTSGVESGLEPSATTIAGVAKAASTHSPT